MKFLLRLLPLWFAACWAFAQSLGSPAGKLPPAPPDGIHDPSRLLAASPSRQQAISESLRKLEAAHGFRIFLYIESVFLNTTPTELADNLKPLWIPDGKGLILVYEFDTKRLGVSQDLFTSDPVGNPSDSKLPAHETTRILATAFQKADRTLSPENYLTELIRAITTSYDAYFAQAEKPRPFAQTLRPRMLLAGGLAVAALLALSVIISGKSRAARLAGKSTFPTVDCAERLRAPAGAAVVSRKFK